MNHGENDLKAQINSTAEVIESNPAECSPIVINSSRTSSVPMVAKQRKRRLFEPIEVDEDEPFEEYSARHDLDGLYSDLLGALDHNRPKDLVGFCFEFFQNLKFVQNFGQSAPQTERPEETPSPSLSPKNSATIQSCLYSLANVQISPKQNALLSDIGCYVNHNLPYSPKKVEAEFLEHITLSAEDSEQQWTTKDNITAEATTPPLDGSRTFFSFDIGGTLCKICIFMPSDKGYNGATKVEAEKFCEFLRASCWAELDEEQTVFLNYGATLKFAIASSQDVPQIVKEIREAGFLDSCNSLVCTGGGAFKYKSCFDKIPGLLLHKVDELWALLSGMNFFLENDPDEAYCFTNLKANQLELANAGPCTWTNKTKLYPYILVNIGSGCSILKVDGPITFTRVSGTCIGGATYWGLVKALCADEGNLNAADAFRLAIGGNKLNVDMCVKDIYGGAYEKFNLKADTVAAAFGKVAINDVSVSDLANNSDIARSLLDMIGMNIAQLAYLSAKRFGLERLVFAGNFLRHNDLTMKALAFSIEYWSKSSMQAAFLKHEGYFGACGGLMTETEHFEPSTPYNPSENLKMPTGRRRHSITRSPQIKQKIPLPASEEQLSRLRSLSKTQHDYTTSASNETSPKPCVISFRPPADEQSRDHSRTLSPPGQGSSPTYSDVIVNFQTQNDQNEV